jgi:hypothetical protein
MLHSRRHTCDKIITRGAVRVRSIAAAIRYGVC